MLMPIKNWLAGKLLYVALCYSIGVTILLLMPIPEVAQEVVPFSDKVAHLGVYALLSLLWVLVATQKKGAFKTAFWLVFLILSAYGMVIEVVQGNFIASRSFDVWDIVANTFGIILGLLLYYFGRKKDWI